MRICQNCVSVSSYKNSALGFCTVTAIACAILGACTFFNLLRGITASAGGYWMGSAAIASIAAGIIACCCKRQIPMRPKPKHHFDYTLVNLKIEKINDTPNVSPKIPSSETIKIEKTPSFHNWTVCVPQRLPRVLWAKILESLNFSSQEQLSKVDRSFYVLLTQFWEKKCEPEEKPPKMPWSLFYGRDSGEKLLSVAKEQNFQLREIFKFPEQYNDISFSGNRCLWKKEKVLEIRDIDSFELISQVNLPNEHGYDNIPKLNKDFLIINDLNLKVFHVYSLKNGVHQGNYSGECLHIGEEMLLVKDNNDGIQILKIETPDKSTETYALKEYAPLDIKDSTTLNKIKKITKVFYDEKYLLILYVANNLSDSLSIWKYNPKSSCYENCSTVNSVDGIYEGKNHSIAYFIKNNKLCEINLMTFKPMELEFNEHIITLFPMDTKKFCVYGDKHLFIYEGNKFIIKKREYKIGNFALRETVANGNFLMNGSPRNKLLMFERDTENLISENQFDGRIYMHSIFDNKIFIHARDEGWWQTERIFCLEEKLKKKPMNNLFFCIPSIPIEQSYR